ncbi:GNAT family N-acetyltransferase [Paenibacillus sp. YYML68]|uniref:GNAT family N-acetyltransferase n=1 Tax=Paenibacillus sp. YYML68 TaxID=2909250 RepID=UPI0024901148|nr:GNAT family N-acetyltransferase [Paenibacillus sp. YYML68]
MGMKWEHLQQVIQVTTAEQLQQCLQVRSEVFVKEQGVPSELEVDELDVSPDAARHFLMLDGEVPIAAARYKMYDAHTAKLQRIAVLPSYRGQGLGKRLVQRMEDDIRSRGIGRVMLDSQTHAAPFYTSAGYSIQSEEPFLDAGMWHVRMTKQLASFPG